MSATVARNVTLQLTLPGGTEVDKVHVNDLHATILHQLGFNHEKLTYVYNGRRFRLTDVGGKVIHPIVG